MANEYVKFNHIAEVVSRVEKSAQDLGNRSSKRIAQRASELAPRKTGQEAGDFKVEKTSEGYVIGNESPHFMFQELGTRRNRAHPALHPAAREEESKLKEDAEKAIKMAAEL